jgi:hypothetical protein
MVKVSFCFGAFPVVFDINHPREKIQQVKSRRQRVRCSACISIVIIVAVIIIIKFIYDVSVGSIVVGELFSMVQVIVGIGSSFGVFCHIHTVCKLDELLAFINGIAGYYEQYQGKCYSMYLTILNANISSSRNNVKLSLIISIAWTLQSSY